MDSGSGFEESYFKRDSVSIKVWYAEFSFLKAISFVTFPGNLSGWQRIDWDLKAERISGIDAVREMFRVV